MNENSAFPKNILPYIQTSIRNKILTSPNEQKKPTKVEKEQYTNQEDTYSTTSSVCSAPEQTVVVDIPLDQSSIYDEYENSKDEVYQMQKEFDKKGQEEKDSRAKHTELQKKLISIVLMSICVIVLLLSLFSYTRTQVQLSPFDYHISLADVILLLIFRSSYLLFVIYFKVLNNSTVYEIAYWLSTFSFILLICKACVQDSFDWDIGLVEENEERKKRKELNEKKENEFHQRRQLYSENRDMESYANLEEEYEAWKEREKYIDRCSRVQQLKEKYKNSPTIKEILQQLKPYFIPDTLNTKLLTILTTLMQILSKACSIYNPQFIGYTIDGQQNKDKKLTFHSLFIYVFLRIGSYICKEQQNSFYIKVKSDASIRVAGKTFEHIHNLSHNWHLKKKMGVLQRSMQRGISASDSVVSYLFLYIVPSMIECFVVFIIFYKLFNLPEQTSIVFFFLASYVTITIQVTKSRKKYRRSSNEYDNQVNECTNDSFTNFESVKYFCNEKHETNKYIDKIKKYQNAYTITQYTLSIQNSQQSLCIHGCLLLSLFITCKRILNDNMTIGEFTTVNSYVISQFTPQSFLGTIYDTVLQSFVDIQNLQQLQNEVPEIYDKHNAKELNQINKNTNKKSAKIEFKNVYFNYPTQTKRYNIENLSFTIDEGTTTALVGATGSGKSTIGKLLFRFYDINSGNIYINDQDIRDITIKSLRDSIGVVPQDVTLFNDTIKYNIQYGNFTASFTEQERVCELARIYDFITDQKDQWDTVVGERGLRLSGGEKQRISIARALLKDPTIVLQDEATSAQDTINEREIQQALQNQQKDRTMVIIAHRLSTIRHADQILVLDNGKIVERGKHDEQQKLNGKYAELWRCQAQDLRELMSDDSVSNNSNGDDNIDNDNTINDISQNGIVSSKNNDLLSSLDLVSTKHNSRNKLNIDSDSFRHSILDTPVSSK